MVKQIAIAIEQLLNTFIQDGFADETLSARAYRMTDVSIEWRYVHITFDWLFKLIGKTNHCYESYLAEKNRSQLPKEYQERHYKTKYNLFTSKQEYDINNPINKIG